MLETEILLPTEMCVGSLTIFNVPELGVSGIGLICEIDYANSPIIDNHYFFNNYLMFGNHKHKPQHLYIVSLDDIKVDDYYIITIDGVKELKKAIINIDKNDSIRKVLASTNPIISNDITDEYLKEFINNYNKKI